MVEARAGWAMETGGGRRRDERSSEGRERGSPRGGRREADGCVARGSESGGESTNEKTNALRSKEHACSSARENVAKRKRKGG